MTQLEEMACRELVEVITEYFEGTLPEPDRMRFEAHLAVCSSCRRYLEQMRQTVDVLGGLTEDSIPEPDKEQLLALFKDWKQR